MAYRKKKKHWKKKARYKTYLKKSVELTELAKARKNFNTTLNKILDRKIQEYWDNIIQELQVMKFEIEELGEVPDKNKSIPVIKYCLSFLEIVSRYQDILDNGIRFSPLSKSEAVKKFNDDLTFAGRHTKEERMTAVSGIEIPFWNTTSRGEPITENNIFFGPDIGLPQRPANYWLNLKKSQRVAVTLTKNFEKGKLTKKPILMWSTAALVKYSSIHTFCKIGKKRFAEALNEILA